MFSSLLKQNYIYLYIYIPKSRIVRSYGNSTQHFKELFFKVAASFYIPAMYECSNFSISLLTIVNACLFIYLFIWLHLVLVAARRIFAATCRIFIAVWGIFSCGIWELQLWHVNSQLQHVGSSSLARDQARGPCIGSAEPQPLDHEGNLILFVFLIIAILLCVKQHLIVGYFF